jgi:hypothetical protein
VVAVELEVQLTSTLELEEVELEVLEKLLETLLNI